MKKFTPAMDATVTKTPNKTTAKETSKAIYLPGLNGLRAIAALAVVISHITLNLSEFGLNDKIFGSGIDGKSKGLDLAGSGVTIFFTLSGFLITFLLLKEKEIGSIKVKNFYIRRLLRIWPLYYLYFFIAIVTMIIFGINFQKNFIPFYLFLTANIPFLLEKNLPFLGHYWSLGVEEQFYLFFPHLAKQSNKKLLKISLLLIFIFLFSKAVFWVLSKKYGITFPLLVITVNRFHTMLIGVIGAILYYDKNKKFIFLTTHKITQLFAWSCIFLLAINRTDFFTVIHEEFISVITVFLIMGQITRKNYIINLENKFCDFIGKISYGIYVIHPLLIFYYSKLLVRFNSASFFNYILIYFLIISTSVVTAYLSYKFYEKQFLKLKFQYTAVKSSSVRNGE